jgi:RND superfamily putative drug exporter
MVTRHWPIGETAPLTLLVSTPGKQSPAAWTALHENLVRDLKRLPTVDNIRGISTPLGLHVGAAENKAVMLLASKKIQEHFLSPDGRAMRLVVIFKTPPLINAAMDEVAVIERIARAACASLSADVKVAGATAEMVDIRTITQRDFRLIAILSLVAILLLIVILLRDIPLALFMIAATVLSYFTTIGVTAWVFELFGHGGLEWKVQVFVFIVLIAVGQDYNIFFAVRLAQETADAGNLSLGEAVRRAVVHTGPVISSCGVIMAASLGSVMASDVVLLVQLGFAFALGMLIDTFIVRPLLLPAFILLTSRRLQNAAGWARAAH